MRKVLVTDTDVPLTEFGFSGIEALGGSLIQASATDRTTLEREASDAAVLVVDRASVGEAVIAAAARGGCRAIVRCGIGYENVDLAAAERHGIPVANVPDYCLDEVADHTMALLLAHARRLVTTRVSVEGGQWAVPKGLVPRLAGRILGLVGIGRIGSRVAARAHAFGLIVQACDPLESAVARGVQKVSLDELWKTADYISLHVPLTESTRHIVNADALHAMRKQPLLINTSRGGLIDLDAVIGALDDGTLSGIALDVFDNEPLAQDHPLRRQPLAVITPHMAYYSNESERELIERVLEEVARALRGEPLLHAITSVRVARHA